MRNDHKNPQVWALPGGKLQPGETLLGGMERECTEELGAMPKYLRLIPLDRFTSADQRFEYNTWVCVIEQEFCPQLNHEHLGHAWLDPGVWPKPMHPGLWNSLNLDEVQQKLRLIEQTDTDQRV